LRSSFRTYQDFLSYVTHGCRKLTENKIPMLGVQLHERDAYRALFAFGGTLSGLDPAQVSNVPAAILNARVFSNEVVNLLKPKTPVAKAEEVA
jgi:chromosome partitioning protein